MDRIDELFNLMDDWRHLPSYQLERRADLFFSLYLSQVLSARLGIPVCEKVIPEFPVLSAPRNNRSCKIDYLAISPEENLAILVELKTNMQSIGKRQIRNLCSAKHQGLKGLLKDVKYLFSISPYTRKYFCLLKLLAQMNLLEIPLQLTTAIERNRFRDARSLAEGIRITTPIETCSLVYIVPNLETKADENEIDKVITFDDFVKVVRLDNSPVSKRFAQSLAKWANVEAGYSC